MKKIKLMLDNNFIDVISEYEELFDKFSNKIEVYVCSSILEELANMPDKIKEKRIINIIDLARLEPKFVNDAVLVLDYSRFDCANLGDGIVYEKILNKSQNNIRDAIIAETSVANNCYLVSCDKRLINKMKSNNYNAILNTDLKTFLASI